MAAADPTNGARYLGLYNQQAAQIDQAYSQMKLDTIRDRTKLETSLPNLAEFESFYSIGGERDALNLDMQLGLSGGLSQEIVNYRMLDLTNRRVGDNE